jgi:hypothetical protein
MSSEDWNYKPYEEYTQEELLALGRKIEIERNERIRFNRHCKKIRKKFERGKIKNLKSHWHLSKDGIDFRKQTHQLNKEFFVDGYTIIETIDVETLLDSMQGGNPELYRSRQMYHDDWSPWNISKIIDFWVNEEKLIPPTLILNEELNKTYLADGKHRFNVAYCLGDETIPVIVPNKDLVRIQMLIVNK